MYKKLSNLLDLNISHMTGKVWNIGKRYKKIKTAVNVVIILYG